MLERRVHSTQYGAREKSAPSTVAPPRAFRAAATTGVRGTANRSFFLLIIMTLCAGALVSRLAFWQVMQHGRLAAQAAPEHTLMAVQTASRGRIFDSAGDPLATNVTMDTVYAVPKEIKNPARTAQLVAPLLHQPAGILQQEMTGDSLYVQLATHVSQSTGHQLLNFGLTGIGADPTIVRDYPEGPLASQLLGYVDVNDHGQYGLEGYDDPLLSGKADPGSVLRGSGRGAAMKQVPASQPLPGGDLHLTIDPTVQNLVEDELTKAVKLHSADSGTAIVMDTRTGYILGMANTPSFDPNRYNTVSDMSRFTNAAVTDDYEPGSTFKIITMAAGLDSHVITPQSAFEDTGTFMVDGIALHNWNMLGNGWENMTQVLQHSANVGAAWVANNLGATLFYKYVHRFGFGHLTGIAQTDEAPGTVWLPGQKQWTIVNLYTNAFGQGLTVTPLQLIRAVEAVANRGVMMKPQLIRSIDYRGHLIKQPPVALGRVISAQTASTLTDMLVHSAIGGEASLALVKGYDIAAKTGTASVAGPNGQYIQNDTVASTIAYAPAYHPRLIALVILRHPRDTRWGSLTAAPVLHNLFQELFMYYHIPPSPNALNR